MLSGFSACYRSSKCINSSGQECYEAEIARSANSPKAKKDAVFRSVFCSSPKDGQDRSVVLPVDAVPPNSVTTAARHGASNERGNSASFFLSRGAAGFNRRSLPRNNNRVSIPWNAAKEVCVPSLER